MAINQSCYGLQGEAAPGGITSPISPPRTGVSALQRRAHGSVFDTITRDGLAGVFIAVPSPETVDAFEAAVGPILLNAQQESLVGNCSRRRVTPSWPIY